MVPALLAHRIFVAACCCIGEQSVLIFTIWTVFFRSGFAGNLIVRTGANLIRKLSVYDLVLYSPK